MPSTATKSPKRLVSPSAITNGSDVRSDAGPVDAERIPGVGTTSQTTRQLARRSSVRFRRETRARARVAMSTRDVAVMPGRPLQQAVHVHGEADGGGHRVGHEEGHGLGRAHRAPTPRAARARSSSMASRAVSTRIRPRRIHRLRPRRNGEVPRGEVLGFEVGEARASPRGRSDRWTPPRRPRAVTPDTGTSWSARPFCPAKPVCSGGVTGWWTWVHILVRAVGPVIDWMTPRRRKESTCPERSGRGR